MVGADANKVAAVVEVTGCTAPAAVAALDSAEGDETLAVSIIMSAKRTDAEFAGALALDINKSPESKQERKDSPKSVMVDMGCSATEAAAALKSTGGNIPLAVSLVSSTNHAGPAPLGVLEANAQGKRKQPPVGAIATDKKCAKKGKIHTHMHTHTHTCTHACMHTCMHACMHTCIHV